MLRIGTNVWPGYEPLFYARAKQLLPADKFTLVEFGSATEVIRSLRSHLVDIAALTLDEVLLLAHDGIDVRIVLVTDISNGADVIVAPPSTHGLGDLKGKRIGVEDTALGGYMLGRALQLANMDKGEIIPVYLEFDRHEEAYLQGKLDAVVTFEPVRSTLLGRGQKVIFSSAEIPGEIVDVVVVRGEIYDKHPEQCHELIEIWFQTLQRIAEEPDAAETFIAERRGMSLADFRRAMEGLEVPTREENRRMLLGQSASLRTRIRAIADFMRESGRFTRDFDIDRIMDTDLQIDP